MHRAKQNGDKMGNNTGRTNMAERIIRLWLSETEMIACGGVSELDAFQENTNALYGCQMMRHRLTVYPHTLVVVLHSVCACPCETSVRRGRLSTNTALCDLQ